MSKQLAPYYRFLLTLFMVAAFAAAAQAVVETYQFDNESQRQRYHQFIDELRCPKCQNQNLAGSNSPIAADLRRELHRMILASFDDDNIVKFMVDRYGEFVLYRPPLDKNTLFLWTAPVALLFVGLVLAVSYARRRANAVLGTAQDSTCLSDLELTKLREMLGQDYRS